MDNKSLKQTSTKESPQDYYKDKEIQKETSTSTDVIPDEVPRSDGPGGE